VTLPDANFLPAPLWLFTALHILTLSLHFAAMNFLLGGILIVLPGSLKGGSQGPGVRRFLRLFPAAMAATVTLGIAPLLFLQTVYPLQLYPAAIVSGWFWLLIIPAVILSYYLLYASSFSGNGDIPNAIRYLRPALIGLLYVSLVYSSVFSMAERPELIHRLYAQSQTGFLWNPEAGDYFLRWLHMILGALTLGGFFAGLLAKDDMGGFARAKKIFAYSFAASAAAGLAYLLTLREFLPDLMRTSTIWLLAVGIFLTLGALHFYFRRRFLLSGLLLFPSLVLMVAVRHQVRLLKLRESFDPASWRISPQWAPFLIFLVGLIIAVWLTIHMLRLFFKGKRSAVSPQLSATDI
jgi:hypothetical protein